MNGNEILADGVPRDPALTTIVFFDTASKDDAVSIAKIHPGLRYGVTVDVREWTSPRESATAGQSGNVGSAR